ncbi:MAG TPA: NADH-quinone oxidoreductase subunit J [Candidatus Polarisedimenticolia bacterium]|nr:NADH-quinone oxidoreductase subunit J [Candidatus Polarisedimenticolia bacterium]
MSPRELIFYADAIVALLTASVVVLHRNPVVCAVSLVAHLCSMAAFFLLLDASFLFAVQVILYAGAIMVLFLFVVMLLDPAGEGVTGRRGNIQMVATVGGALLLLAVMTRTMTGPQGRPAAESLPSDFGRVAGIGRLLFTDYLFPFEVASILLLVAMIGALYMGRKEVD